MMERDSNIREPKGFWGAPLSLPCSLLKVKTKQNKTVAKESETTESHAFRIEGLGHTTKEKPQVLAEGKEQEKSNKRSE